MVIVRFVRKLAYRELLIQLAPHNLAGTGVKGSFG
jgi:hypothetical protein